jgi:hypothetical protein
MERILMSISTVIPHPSESFEEGTGENKVSDFVYRAYW